MLIKYVDVKIFSYKIFCDMLTTKIESISQQSNNL